MILDVRTPEEYQDGHADGAINIPLDQLTQGIVPDCSAEEHIRVYCRSGNRAAMAVQILQQHGFMNAENVGSMNNV